MDSSNTNALMILIQDYYNTHILFDTRESNQKYFVLPNQNQDGVITVHDIPGIKMRLNMLANRIFIKIGIGKVIETSPEESDILKNASFMKRPIDIQILAKQILESRDKKINTITSGM